jgi:hypothetical protein
MERRREYRHHEFQEDPAAAGLHLVERTAKLIRAAEDHAAEMSARSAAAVAHLQEEMRLAERVLEAAETRRRIAEAEVKELRSALEESERARREQIETLTLELKTSLDQSEKMYEVRIDELNANLMATQRRAALAEERADVAESALGRIQSAMEGILQIRSTGQASDVQWRERESANGHGEPLSP